MIKTTTFASGMPEVSQVDLEVANFREQFEGRDLFDQLVRRGAQRSGRIAASFRSKFSPRHSAGMVGLS